MAQPGVGTCSIIVWDTKEMKRIRQNYEIWWGGFIHNPPTGELIFCLIQTCVYFPHANALMRDGDMIKVSIIHTHSPSTYFQPYVLLCCSISHYCPQFLSLCSGEGAVSNSPEEKQRMCFKVYFDVNNTNLCFRTTTSYDGMERPALQNI